MPAAVARLVVEGGEVGDGVAGQRHHVDHGRGKATTQLHERRRLHDRTRDPIQATVQGVHDVRVLVVERDKRGRDPLVPVALAQPLELGARAVKLENLERLRARVQEHVLVLKQLTLGELELGRVVAGVGPSLLQECESRLIPEPELALAVRHDLIDAVLMLVLTRDVGLHLKVLRRGAHDVGVPARSAGTHQVAPSRAMMGGKLLHDALPLLGRYVDVEAHQGLYELVEVNRLGQRGRVGRLGDVGVELHIDKLPRVVQHLGGAVEGE